MIHAIAEWVFSALCHQQGARSWAPGGSTLALCQRCVGVYAGASLTLCLLPWMRFRPRRLLTALHGAFVLQMVVLGRHFVPHSAAIRTLSGQAFIVGASYFVCTHLVARVGLRQDDASPRPYLLGIAIAGLILQGLVRAPFAVAAPILELLSLGGLGAIMLVTVLTLGDMVWRPSRSHAAPFDR